MSNLARRRPSAVAAAAKQLRDAAESARRRHRADLDLLERGVCALRALGATWAQVAAATGLPRSTVHRRFRYVDFDRMAVVKRPGQPAAFIACDVSGRQVIDVTDLVCMGDQAEARAIVAGLVRDTVGQVEA